MTQPRYTIVPDQSPLNTIGENTYTRYTLWIPSTTLPSTPNGLRRELRCLARQISTLLDLHSLALYEQDLPEAAALHAGLLAILRRRYQFVTAKLADYDAWRATVAALEANDGQ